MLTKDCGSFWFDPFGNIFSCSNGGAVGFKHPVTPAINPHFLHLVLLKESPTPNSTTAHHICREHVKTRAAVPLLPAPGARCWYNTDQRSRGPFACHLVTGNGALALQTITLYGKGGFLHKVNKASAKFAPLSLLGSRGLGARRVARYTVDQ